MLIFSESLFNGQVLMALEEKILLEQQSNRFETSTERKTLIIFDWDDTLFPSTWLRSEWKPLCRSSRC